MQDGLENGKTFTKYGSKFKEIIKVSDIVEKMHRRIGYDTNDDRLR